MSQIDDLPPLREVVARARPPRQEVARPEFPLRPQPDEPDRPLRRASRGHDGRRGRPGARRAHARDPRGGAARVIAIERDAAVPAGACRNRRPLSGPPRGDRGRCPRLRSAPPDRRRAGADHRQPPLQRRHAASDRVAHDRGLAALVAIAHADVPARGRGADRRRRERAEGLRPPWRAVRAGAPQANILFDVPPSAFVPPPKITSSVVHLTPRAAPCPAGSAPSRP